MSGLLGVEANPNPKPNITLTITLTLTLIGRCQAFSSSKRNSLTAFASRRSAGLGFALSVGFTGVGTVRVRVGGYGAVGANGI